MKSSLPGDGCYFYQVLISILLFADDIVLLASSPDRLQRLLDGLALFCDQRQLVVNLGKTRVMVFNCLKTSHLHFIFQGQEIEITSSYLYLGVLFSGPRFSMRPAIQPRVNKGMGSLALLEKQCFKHHFQYTPSKLSLLDALVRPIVLYGSVVWGPSLLSSDWASIERVQTLFLRRIIRCHRSTPHSIILAEFGAHPFRLAAIFDLVWFLHRLRGFADMAGDRDRYSYLAYCSSVSTAAVESGARARCWYAQVSSLLSSIGIDIDHLPPFQFSLDAPAHLLPSRQELNEHVRLDIYRCYITATWVNPPGGLRPRMSFYATHFLEISDGIITRPSYLSRRWSHALRISLGSFRVGSHRLRAQSDHQIAREERTCVFCTSGEVENEAHFLFRCPIYYEIRGRFFCLFRECFSLYDFFSYYDQRCLALYLREATMLRDSMIQTPLPHPYSSTQLITAFFTPLSPLRGVKRPSSSIRLDELSRRVRSRSTYMHQRHFSGTGRRQYNTSMHRHMFHAMTDFFLPKKAS